MRQALALCALAMAAACASHPPGSSREAHGRAIAEQYCSSCHATGPADASPAPEAPAFRTLSQNYRVDSLEEALAEGIIVGHPAMPQFQFAPDEVDALIAYLQSIQPAPTGRN